jgi:hypothetical protein
MAYYRDLDCCTYFDLENDDALVAVGWLEAGNDFPRGPVDPQFFERLESLALRPWRPIMFLGGDECEFCQYQRPSFDTDLFIPYNGRIFAAPAGITHYISAHWYQPPDEFIQAVTACPDMASAEYGQALAANGGHELAQDFEPHWDEEFKKGFPPPESCIMGGCIMMR